MKRFLFAAIAVAGATLGATQASAADFTDSFRFEFGAATSAPLRDDYKYRSDFLHYGDYYLTPGYGNPQLNTVCRETTFRDEEGRVIRRITCHDR